MQVTVTVGRCLHTSQTCLRFMLTGTMLALRVAFGPRACLDMSLRIPAPSLAHSILQGIEGGWGKETGRDGVMQAGKDSSRQ